MRILLDANVLVDAQVRDLFLSLAEAEVIDVKWSAKIATEAQRALVDRLGLAPSTVRRLGAEMSRAFPSAVVVDYEDLIEGLILPDVDDRHVLAAALASHCDVLVTENVRDFPQSATAGHGLVVCDTDAALAMIIEAYGEVVGAVVKRQLAALTRPQVTSGTFLTRLHGRAPTAANALQGFLQD